MTGTLVKYGQHEPVLTGAACEACRAVTLDPVTDHCHAHGWVRGILCRQCNTRMALIDRRRVAPQAAPEVVAALIGIAGRCPDCPALTLGDLTTLHDRASFPLFLPRDLHHRLKVASAVSGESMNDMLIRAAEDILRPATVKQESP
jgi:Recombination endonuclease VII